MATYKKNYRGLIDYLATVGLDANRIPEATATEKGFEYIEVDGEGRPKRTQTNRLVREWREWPSPEVYHNVSLLLMGYDLPTEETAPEPEVVVVAEDKPAPVKKAPAPRAKTPAAGKGQ